MAFSIHKIHGAGMDSETFSALLSGRQYDFRTIVNSITGYVSMDVTYNGRELITGAMMLPGSVAANQSYGIACEVSGGAVYVAIKENAADSR